MSVLSQNQLEAVKLQQKGQSTAAIASAIGVSSRTIERWRLLPEYQDEVKKLHKITCDTAAKKWIKEAQDLCGEHLELHQMARSIAVFALKKYQVKMESEEIEDLDIRRISQWSMMLDRHIEAERRVASIDLLNVNRAYALLTSLGYEVSNPVGEDLPEY